MFSGFKDRRDAGRKLAHQLKAFARDASAIVLGLPRGGMPVAYEIARELQLPLDVFVVRKLGVPGHEELAFGAIASGGAKFINEPLVRSLRMTRPMIDEVLERESAELERRERLYRGNRAPTDIAGKTVILVDDGIATGASMRVAVSSIKTLSPKQVIVAVPVSPPETCEEFNDEVDVWCVCVVAPRPFYAVGAWYLDFSQTTDEEVELLLARADAGEIAAMHRI